MVIASESGNVTETIHAHRNDQFASWQETSRTRPSPTRGATTTDHHLTLGRAWLEQRGLRAAALRRHHDL